MTARFRICAALVAATCLGGCAIEPTTAPSAYTSSVRKKVIRAERLREAVVIGKSTRSEVIAALGETLVISLDTGHEVWVYRLAASRDAEFVILFAPSGIVAKTRLR